MSIFWTVAGVVATMLATTACEDSASMARVPDGYATTRFIDHEADVVCWLYRGYEQGGISCLPLASTALKDGPEQ